MGVSPQVAGALRRHHEECGGTVGDLRGVAGRDDTVLLEDRREGAELLERAAGADALVPAEVLRLPLLGESGDGEDLLGEDPGLGRGECARMRFERQLIELRAREVPALRDHLRTLALAEALTAVALRDGGAEGLARPVVPLGAHGHARHRLDASGDDDVTVACDDGGDGEGECLLGRSARTVDGRPRDGLREAGRQSRPPADVRTLLPHLGYAAEDHVLDQRGVDPVPLHESAQHVRPEVDGMDVAQGSAPPAHCCTRRIDDHCFRHRLTPSWDSTVRAVSNSVSPQTSVSPQSSCTAFVHPIA